MVSIRSAVLIALAVGCSAEHAVKRVVVIVADQHNARAVGCYGNERMKTPALDRIAREGVRFTNAFCNTPQCSPSRFTMWTGRYAASHGLVRNNVPESTDETTLADIFGPAGWTTAAIGKHHMTSSPREHGFDVVVDAQDFQAWQESAGGPRWNVDGSWLDFTKGVLQGWTGKSDAPNEFHRDGWFTTQAIEFLREHREQPFLLWLAFYGPHTPIAVSPPFSDTYQARDVELPPGGASSGPSGHPALDDARALHASFGPFEHRMVTAAYWGFVAQLDFNVGRVLDELDALGIADDTIVVYTADHGDMAGAKGIWGKHFFLYDEVLRVPLLVRGPNLPKGAVESSLVSLVDFAPTVLEACGLPAPESFEGRSMLSLLQGRASDWPEIVFAEIGAADVEWGRSTAARSAAFKYVLNDEGNARGEQLFDLERDPWETENRIGDASLADERNELRAALAEWSRARGVGSSK